MGLSEVLGRFGLWSGMLVGMSLECNVLSGTNREDAKMGGTLSFVAIVRERFR